MKTIAAYIVAVSFACLSAASTVGAGPSKEGSGPYRSARSAQISMMKMGDNRMQINYDETGIVVDAPADSPFHNASFRTMGTIHVVEGRLAYNGSALWTRPNGDRIYGIFTGKGVLGKGSSGFLEIVGGQGECEGITGTLELTSGPHAQSSKSGYSMGTTVGTIRWKIP